MTEKKDKLFPFAWAMAAIVILAFIGYYLYVHSYKGEKTIELHAALIDKKESDKTVNAYIQFVSEQDGKMGLEHSYTNEALLKLSHAVNAMAKAAGYTVKADLGVAESDAEKITLDPMAITHADDIRKAAGILSQALYNLQQQKYPSLVEEAEQVKISASKIDPDVLTLDQKNNVKAFFTAAATLLNKMN